MTDTAAQEPAVRSRHWLYDNRALRTINRIWTWLVFMPLFAVATAVCGTLAIVFGYLAGDRAGSWFGRPWAWWAAVTAPMWVRVRGRENVDPTRSYVVVANHQSQFDIFVLYGWLGMDFRWVMKAELRKVPFIGWSTYRLGHVFVDRRDSAAAWASIQAARKRLKPGTSICFFPEGTRSDDGNLLPFKKGAFRLAADLGWPILPVTIRGSRDILPNRKMALLPGLATMTIHPPIAAPAADDPDAVEAVTKEVRAVIASAL